MPLPRYCPNCGELVSEDATFCAKCGSSVGATQPPTPQPYPARSSYSPSRSALPSHLSQRVERAWRRVELLSYAVVGLSVIILLETLYWVGLFG
jgi:hypothetical protein